MGEQETSVSEPKKLKLSTDEELNKCWQLIYREDEKCKVNLDPLYEMLDEFQDIPIMCISVTGPQRTGKSFIMNLLILYLESKTNSESSDWLHKDQLKKTIPTHFKWTNSTDPETEGIVFWSKCYEITIGDNEKVGVMLMDTEGAFSRKTNVDSPLIFAFSTLLSSVQIYNLQYGINMSLVDSLCVFSDFTLDVRQSSEQGSKKHFYNDLEMFPKQLMILIRDFQMENYKLGIEGGSKYVEKELQPIEAQNPNNAQNIIKKLFSEVKGCLLPHPGLVKGEQAKPGQKKLDDLDPDFCIEINSFFEHLFFPAQIKQQMYDGAQVMNFAQKCSRALDDNNETKPATFLQYFNSDKIMKIKDASLHEYKQAIKTAFMQSHFDEDLKISHERKKDEVTKQFQNKCDVYANVDINLPLKLLEDQIEKEYDILKQNKEKEEICQKDKLNFIVQECFILYENTFRDTENFEQAKLKAMKELDRKLCETQEGFAESRGRLEKQIQDQYNTFIGMDYLRKNFTKNQKEALKAFKFKMQQISQRYLLDDDLIAYIKKQEDITIKDFRKAVGETKSAISNEREKELRENIKELSKEATTNNKYWKEILKSHRLVHAMEVRTKFGEFMTKVSNHYYIPPEKLENCKKQFLQLQEEEILKAIPCDHPFFQDITEQIESYVEKEYNDWTKLNKDKKPYYFHQVLLSFWKKIEPFIKVYVVPTVKKIGFKLANDFLSEKFGVIMPMPVEYGPENLPIN